MSVQFCWYHEALASRRGAEDTGEKTAVKQVVIDSIEGCSGEQRSRQGSGMNAWRRRFAPRVPAAEDHGKWAQKTFREERAPIGRPGLLAR